MKNLVLPPEKEEYTYFAHAQDHPFASGDFVAKGAWAADASMLAYARYGAKRMTTAEFQENLARGGLRCLNQIGNWDAHGTQGYLAANEQFAILAFRGSEPDDPVDAIDDADLFLVPEMDHRPEGGASRFVLGLPALVHQGFKRALDRVWADVRTCVMDYRQRHPGAEICFTGHSLGAAMAVLASSRFADGNISVYTFGCPRVGDRRFCDRVVASPLKRMLRFVNLNDSVAHVPLQSVFYRHAPQNCFLFDENGNLAEDEGSFRGDIDALATVFTRFSVDLSLDLSKVSASPGLVDHSPARYCIRLRNCL
ncbi:MAG: lipase family protein [Candidatus Solibacter sp.]